MLDHPLYEYTILNITQSDAIITPPNYPIYTLFHFLSIIILHSIDNNKQSYIITASLSFFNSFTNHTPIDQHKYKYYLLRAQE